MNEVLLPLTYPTITSLPEHADILAILETDPNMYSWIYNHFVQMYMLKDMNRPVPIMFRHFMFDSCPLLNYQRVSREFVKLKWGSFQSFAEECIANGWYVYVNFDQFYIECSELFQKIHMPHPTLVYGFNRSRQTIHVADFYKNYKYSFECIKCELLEKAYFCEKYFGNLSFYDRRFNCAEDIVLISFRNEFRWQFNMELFIKQLSDYLESRNSFKYTHSYEMIHFDDNYFSFGLSIYDTCIDQLEYMITNLVPRFTRFHMFANIRDHKIMMKKRIEYLSNCGICNFPCDVYLSVDELINTFSLMLTLAIKYNFTQNRDILYRLQNYFRVAKEKDKDCMKSIISILKGE